MLESYLSGLNVNMENLDKINKFGQETSNKVVGRC